MERMFSVVIGSQAQKGFGEKEEAFYGLCKDVVSQHALDIYDWEYLRGSSTIRVYIFDPLTGTATIDNCVLVSRSLEAVLEKEEWLSPSTILEISSPGVGRRLSRLCHFKEALERDIAIVLREAVDWAKKGEKVVAKVLAVNEKDIQLEWKEQTISVGWEAIKKANLQEEIRV